MTAGELRAILVDLDDSTPVLIDADPWPMEIFEVQNLIISDENYHGPALALCPEREDDEL